MKRKIFTLFCIAMIATLPVTADDFASFGFDDATDGGDSFSLASDDMGMGDFSFGDSASAENALSWNGKASINPRIFVNRADSAEDQPVSANAEMKLNLEYQGEMAQIETRFKANDDLLKNHPEDVLDEMKITAFMPHSVIEAGKMKVVWGKGDKAHVVDNFNADDFSDFMMPDYIDRRLAMPMISITNHSLDRASFQFVYTPYMIADRAATTGPWTPVTQLDGMKNQVMNEAVKTYGTGVGTAAYREGYSKALWNNVYDFYRSQGKDDSTAKTKADTLVDNLKYTVEDKESLKENIGESKANALYTGMCKAGTANHLASVALQNLEKVVDLAANRPDTRSLKYSQFGLRATGTAGPVDWGASYFYGYKKQPSLILIVDDKIDLQYDRMQVFGLEAAGVLGPFNMRGELAYNLTDDVAGDDPEVTNNSIGWVFGFDVDIPVNEMNLNVQTIGNVKLHQDDITDGDIEYDADNIYTNNKIILALTDSYCHGKINPELKMVWGVERKDFVIMPEITYKPDDNLSFLAGVTYIYSDEDKGEFRDFRDNSFVQASVAYTF